MTGSFRWTVRRVLVVVSLLAPACTLDEVPPLPVEPPPERAAYSPLECSFAFEPDEALVPDVEDAAARWSATTGCDVHVAAGGVPVRVVAGIVRPDGTQAPGVTSAARDRVEINVRIMRSGQLGDTLLHELGHALGGDHTDSDGVLSGQKGRRNVIDTAALETVCSRLPCRWVSPEAP